MSGYYVMRRGSARRSDLVDGFVGYPGEHYVGKQYFVNNAHPGTSGNGGANWDDAMDEFSTAVTAWEAYRALLPANNQNVRGEIFIQGTATAYGAITSLPSYCDVYGFGRDAHGNGAGVVRIGADTGSDGGLTGTSTVRGLYMHNIQFQAGVSNYAFQLSNIYGSVLEHCVFASNGSPGGSPAAGVEVDKASGLIMRNCNWLNQSSLTNGVDVGFDVTGTHFHGCIIDNCQITGKTAGFRLASSTISGYNSFVQNGYIGWGGSECAIGVDDNATVGHVIFQNLSMYATDEFDMVHNGANRIINCTAANALVTA